MLRFISHIFKLNYEVCKSCETLNKQLEIERTENAQLLESLLNITRPTIVEQSVKEIEPIKPKGIPWHRRQRELEENDKNEARILRQRAIDDLNDNKIKTQSVEELEEELGIANAQ